MANKLTVKSESTYRHTKQVIGYGEVSISGKTNEDFITVQVSQNGDQRESSQCAAVLIPITDFWDLITKLPGAPFVLAVALLLSACGGEAFESQLFVQTGGTAGAGGATQDAGQDAPPGGAAGATQDAGQDAPPCQNYTDNNACTIDECNPVTGEVSHIPFPVDDFNACTTDTCDPKTAEVSHTPVEIDDNKACTVDTCDPTTGIVSHDQLPAIVKCNYPGYVCDPGYEKTSTLNPDPNYPNCNYGTYTCTPIC